MFSNEAKNKFYPSVLTDLINTLKSLPGIGQRSAERLALDIISWRAERQIEFSNILLSLKDKIKSCTICGNLCEEEKCFICEDLSRDSSILCILEQAVQISAIEKSISYRGKYHIIGGKLKPLEGIGPDDLNINSLIKRVQEEAIEEVILAISSDIEGEATASYIASELALVSTVKVTRLATGIPVGADISYADISTLSTAILKRNQY